MTDATATPEQPLFDALEVEQFEADDVQAGAAIGKMLSALVSLYGRCHVFRDLADLFVDC